KGGGLVDLVSGGQLQARVQLVGDGGGPSLPGLGGGGGLGGRAGRGGGGRGAHPCQAAMTSAAWAGGPVRWKLLTCGAGTVPNRSEVTTPKLPAPAPRSPQHRSWVLCSSQSM